MMPNIPQPNETMRQLASLLRDKYLADARQAMKAVRKIERDFGLERADMKKER